MDKRQKLNNISNYGNEIVTMSLLCDLNTSNLVFPSFSCLAFLRKSNLFWKCRTWPHSKVSANGQKNWILRWIDIGPTLHLVFCEKNSFLSKVVFQVKKAKRTKHLKHMYLTNIVILTIMFEIIKQNIQGITKFLRKWL